MAQLWFLWPHNTRIQLLIYSPTEYSVKSNEVKSASEIVKVPFRKNNKFKSFFVGLGWVSVWETQKGAKIYVEIWTRFKSYHRCFTVWKLSLNLVRNTKLQVSFVRMNLTKCVICVNAPSWNEYGSENYGVCHINCKLGRKWTHWMKTRCLLWWVFILSQTNCKKNKFLGCIFNPLRQSESDKKSVRKKYIKKNTSDKTICVTFREGTHKYQGMNFLKNLRQKSFKLGQKFYCK